MGDVLAIVSQKGGVGKTTTAVNLAAAFARRGLKTLVIGVDPQGSVRYGVGLRRDQQHAGFADYLNGQKSLREIILPTALPWLRVILAGSVTDEADQTTYQQLIAETTILPDLLETAREGTNAPLEALDLGRRGQVQRRESRALGVGRLLTGPECRGQRVLQHLAVDERLGELADRLLAAGPEALLVLRLIGH